MVVELIAKDKNEIFQFEGKCKLKINSISKLLLVEPYNEEFKMISAMFKCKFVAQKNILFIFGEHDFQDFALVFDNSNKCNQVYEILVKKGASGGNIQLIKERFLPSLFVEISKNTVSITKLKEIFVKWIKLFDGNEKEEYVQLLKNYNIYDIFYPMKYGNKRRKYRSQNGNLNFVDSEHKESDSESAPPKKPKLLRNGMKDKIIAKPNFQLFYYTKRGISKKTLIIFCPSNMKLCYEFYWSIRYQRFFCLGCDKRSFVFAKICKAAANGEEYVKMNKNQHVCDLREFKPSKYLSDIVIEKSMYKIVVDNVSKRTIKYLFIFNTNEKKMCNKFTYSNSGRYFYCPRCYDKKHYILAHLCKNEKGEEYISIQNRQHICEPSEYHPESYKIIVKQNFQLFNYTKRGIKKTTLIVFCPTNMKLCYEFYWSNCRQLFVCQGCEKIGNVNAEICKDVNGEEHVKQNKNEHFCELRQFDPTRYQSDIVVRKPLYEIVEDYIYRKEMKYLIIFTSAEKKMCYKFTYSNSGRYFYCPRCYDRKHYILAHLCKNENGEEYISIQNRQHICEPSEYHPESYKSIVKPNFQLFNYTKRGIKKTTLIVFCPTNMKLCYEFYWNNDSQRHICLGCERIKYVYATICKDANGEEYVQQNRNQHFCELREFDPTRYQSDIVVRKPLYEIVEDYIYRKEMKYLIIFTSAEKKMCYKFTYSGKYFYCSKCHIQKRVIRAHICKNETGEEYISIQDKQHICEPIEYSTKKMEYKYVQADDYQIMKRRFRGKWVQKLYIFTSTEKDLCYDFTWHEKKNYFTCNPCLNRSKNFVCARIIKKNEDEECLELSWKEHVCKPMKYEPPNSILVFKPDFEIKKSFIKDSEITYLFVTHPNDKKCYKYTLSKTQNRFICNSCKTIRSVYAKLWNDEIGVEYIELGKSEHICQSKEEVPSGSNIINLPNFKVVNNGKDLFIFDKNDKEKCYSYVYHPSRKNFLCRKCIAQKRKVSAKLFEYRNGDEYLRIGKNDHICKPEKYQPGPINREYRSKQ